MKRRKLRIAWSVGWGLVCLVLVVLWIVSCWRLIGAVYQHSRGRVVVAAAHGSIALGINRGNTIVAPWQFQNEPIAAASDAWPRRSFKRFADSREGGVFLPIWFLLALSAAFGAIPWVKWRFGLRTVFIATTLVAIALAIIMWMSRAG
jgi:hypothetical protein